MANGRSVPSLLQAALTAALLISDSRAAPGATLQAQVGQTTVAIGGSEAFDVRLDAAGEGVVTVEQGVTFATGIQLICAANPQIAKPQSRFEISSGGSCPASIPAQTCERLHAVIEGGETVIPNGSVLYSCTVQIPPVFPGTTGTCDNPLVCTVASATDATGRTLSTTCTDGLIISEHYPFPPAVTFGFSVKPAAPVVGDHVRVSMSVGGVNPTARYTLSGTAPVLAGDVSSRSEPTYELVAVEAGTATLTLSVNFEAASGCPGNMFFSFVTVPSDPFRIEVAPPPTPTATPTLTPTPTPMADGSHSEDDGSCSTTRPHRGAISWVILVGGLGLWVIRRSARRASIRRGT